MLGFARNIVFFRGNGASAVKKGRLACATVVGGIALAQNLARIARAVELMVSVDFFSSLMMLSFCVSHLLRYFLQWNCCVEDMCSHFQVLEFDGSLARKLCFHTSWMRFEC